MPAPVTLTTPRLRLRPWRESDRAPFAAMSADPDVMAWFPAPLDRSQSDALMNRIQQRIATQGWGFWALEAIGSEPFLGFTGLNRPAFAMPFEGSLRDPWAEIGWRLARPAWGQGLASEAARAALQYGFEHLGLTEIVAFTPLGNQRSAAVMQRLGMQPDGDFEHPALPAGHPLATHLLYRIGADAWQDQRSDAGAVNSP